MKPYYNQAEIDELKIEYNAAYEKYLCLSDRIKYFQFAEYKAKEYANHGLLRRLKYTWRSIERIFKFLPLDLEHLPDETVCNDTVIYHEAFFVNLYGCIDNLAWMLVYEKRLDDKEDLKKKSGELLRSKIGLFKNHEFIRGNLSQEFQDYLNQSDEWLKYLINFRDAIAHRIPIYIPPFVVSDENTELYESLETKKFLAVKIPSLNFAEIEKQQLELREFRPEFIHSLIEEPKSVIIHYQLLVDFKTLYEIILLLLKELPNKPKVHSISLKDLTLKPSP